jgi:hypothetical protein
VQIEPLVERPAIHRDHDTVDGTVSAKPFHAWFLPKP